MNRDVKPAHLVASAEADAVPAVAPAPVAPLPPLPIFEPRQALVPFLLYFWWPLIAYFAVQVAAPMAIFTVVAAFAFTLMVDGRVAGIAAGSRFLALLATPPVAALLVLIAYFAVAAPLAHPDAEVADRAFKLALTVLLGVAAFATIPRFLRDIPPWVVASGTLTAALTAIVDSLIRFRIRGIFPVERIGTDLVAAFVNFPMVTLALLVFPVAAALVETRRRWQIVAIFAAVIVAAIVTKVLTALIAVIAGLAFLALGRWLGTRVTAILLAAGSAVYAFAVPILLPRLDDLLGPAIMRRLSAGYAAERVEIWQIVVAEIRGHLWFGQGLDSLQQLGHHYGRQNRPLGHAHSLFLQVWAEGGLIGIALMVLAVTLVIRTVAALPGSAARWGIAWAAALIAAVSFDFGSLQSWMHATLILTAVAFTGLTGADRPARGSVPLPPRPPR